MPTVLRAHGLRFMIFTDDHEPAHIHVSGDGDAKIAIGGDGSQPVVVEQEQMKKAVLRRAVRAVADHQDMLLLKWAEIHDRSD